MRHFPVLLSWMLSLFFFVACTPEQTNARHEAMLDSAQVEILQNMDYNRAEMLYLTVIKETRNKLWRLLADEGMMKLCQIESKNKEFYDYRSDALKLMAELRTAQKHMDPRNDSIWEVAQSEFKLVSAVYYYNLRDFDKAREILGTSRKQTTSKEDFFAQYIGGHSLYFQSMQKKWKAEELTDSGLYEQALDTLAVALYYVNEHHRKYSFGGIADTLSIYESTVDSLSKEMEWIRNPDCRCVPEWMASIRDQLSITYGAMGLKAESDYNHNIYFDILDATRQDMQMEQQLDELERHERFFDMLLILIAIFAALIVSFALHTYRKQKRKSREKEEKLRSDIELHLGNLMARWMEKNGSAISQIEDDMEYTDDERKAAEMKIEENKRGYVDKVTSVSIANGILPFLDRAIHEVDKLMEQKKAGSQVDAETDRQRREYLMELIDKINSFNEVLGHWVKIKQGNVSLNIESFKLSDLLNVVAKAKNVYESKGLSLSVQDSDSVVKADKALTLFMINTLMDNARKFTPAGGSIKVYAEETADYVEISVQDTGYGMTEDDTRAVITAQKGHGFGLMNCRGIIEKYKKTNKLFSVCLFGVESQLNAGSRFFFRLPLGGKKLTACLLLMLSATCSFSTPQPEQPSPTTSPSLAKEEKGQGSVYLQRARMFADSVFFCNTQAEYLRAVEWGDSVMTTLNTYYTLKTGRTSPLLQVEGEPRNISEIRWWNDHFDMDYSIIVDVRNELAIAALALNKKHLYKYNSDAFTRMYQLLSRDDSLATRIEQLKRTNANKGLVVNLSVLLLVLFLPLLFMFYYHRYLLPLFNLRQVAALSDALFNTPEDRMLTTLYNGINDIITADDVSLAVYNMEQKQLVFSHLSRKHTAIPTGVETLRHFMTLTYHNATPITDPRLNIVTLPLQVEVEGQVNPIGVLGILTHAKQLTSREEQMLRWVAQCVAVCVYSTSTKIEQLQHELELKQDELRRAEAERNRIHVQNMILDNCLSTIKHETMYYPNRIKDLLRRQQSDADIYDLIHYYKEVFTLLSACAMKQLETSAFKRRPIPVADLLAYADARSAFYQHHKFDGLTLHLSPFTSSPSPLTLQGDLVMLQYMLDTLISTAFDVKEPGELHLDVETSTEFCTFSFTDTRRHWSAEQMATLFYADTPQYDPATDRLQGAEYILCRQIIREHDEHCGHRGCRIYAQGGNTLIFTLPRKT